MTDLSKKLKKRWGRKFEDKRDWKPYNEQLVMRGEILLAFDFVKDWNDELADMNCGKVGGTLSVPQHPHLIAGAMAR